MLQRRMPAQSPAGTGGKTPSQDSTRLDGFCPQYELGDQSWDVALVVDAVDHVLLEGLHGRDAVDDDAVAQERVPEGQEHQAGPHLAKAGGREKEGGGDCVSIPVTAQGRARPGLPSGQYATCLAETDTSSRAQGRPKSVRLCFTVSWEQWALGSGSGCHVASERRSPERRTQTNRRGSKSHWEGNSRQKAKRQPAPPPRHSILPRVILAL